MNFRASATRIADVPVVVAEGVVDLASIAPFRDALLRSVHADAGLLVLVDLDGVTAIDDAGLGILLGAAAAARQAGGDLAIVCRSERLRRRLRRTRLDRAIDVRFTVAGSDADG